MAKDTVNIPVLGKTPKGAAVAGLVAVVAVGGWALWKHYKKTSSPTPSGTPSAYGYGAGATSSGYGYGYGYGAYSPYGTQGFGGGGYPYPYSYGYGSGGGTGPPTTNAQWGQLAETTLGSNGHDGIAAALGKYLTGSQITQTQYVTVQEAIAVAGYPPVPGTGNYPPQAHVSKGKPPPGNVTVPNVVGLETDAAMRTLQSIGLNGSHPTLRGGVGSTVTAESPTAGSKVKSGTTIKLSIKEK